MTGTIVVVVTVNRVTLDEILTGTGTITGPALLPTTTTVPSNPHTKNAPVPDPTPPPNPVDPVPDKPSPTTSTSTVVAYCHGVKWYRGDFE